MNDGRLQMTTFGRSVDGQPEVCVRALNGTSK
jgi:hypothetical protein